MGLKDLQAKYKLFVRILIDPIEKKYIYIYILFYQHNGMFIYVTCPSNIQGDH